MEFTALPRFANQRDALERGKRIALDPNTVWWGTQEEALQAGPVAHFGYKNFSVLSRENGKVEWVRWFKDPMVIIEPKPEPEPEPKPEPEPEPEPGENPAVTAILDSLYAIEEDIVRLTAKADTLRDALRILEG